MTTNHSILNQTGHDGTTELVGWTLESEGRGTLTLILSCLATTALCTWIVIHPRVYRQKRHRLLHKAFLWLKTIIAPELIAVEAAQEWTQARRVIRDSAKATDGQLCTVQAFYVGMFGLRYRSSLGTKVLWPNQFIWLLNQDLLDWQQHREWGLRPESIKDKSNADTTVKIFALVQVAWFVAQSVMRTVHQLPLAPLETMTLSYIPLFVVAYGYWWLKPKDIETPSEIELPVMTSDQREKFDQLAIDNRWDDDDASGQESMRSVWTLTPRIFEKEAADNAYEQAKRRYHEARVLRDKHIVECREAECSNACHDLIPAPLRRKETILAHWDPELYHSKILWPLCCLVGISFPALHLLSWNSTFPTIVELWLWRASAIASIVAMLVFMQFEKIVVRWQDPLMLVKIVSPVIYLVTRVIMLAVVFAAFRAADPRIYETYVASTYWVHIL
ncbi:hypothetical protein AC578_9377 [Pseudocercospora eumusae]|uniref:Uncharacterized protein n=1 Tax=Pseudocercospora eumusae TaxID=321146 RepID=A0A139H1S4_9PEZI|nr:hypothetical protein AC578_9377 [Pseudocercospora eumusae]